MRMPSHMAYKLAVATTTVVVLTGVTNTLVPDSKQPTAVQELNPDVPSDLVAVIERLMQKNPGHRYGSFAEVMEALRPFAQSAGGPAVQRRSFRGTRSPPRRFWTERSCGALTW